MTTETADTTTTPDTGDYSITLIKCELKGESLYRRGQPFVMPMVEAMHKFAQQGNAKSRANILNAKPGNYIGLVKVGGRVKNFLLVNRNDDGKIGWILRQTPELSTLIQEVYLVKDIFIRRNAVDLPTTGGVA